jgi:ribosomal protein S12 methylthiotransferase accessory factor YcaO
VGDVFEEAAALIESLSPEPVGPRYYAGLAARLRTEAAAMRRVCEAAERTMRHLSRGGSIDPEDARIIREAWKEDGR